MSQDLIHKLMTIFEGMGHISSTKSIDLDLIIDAMCKNLIDLKIDYTEAQIVQASSELAGRDSFEVYWLARAGFISVIPLLRDRLQGEDECQTMWAAMGLAYLGDPLGLITLEQIVRRIISGGSELTLEEVYDELETSKLDEFLDLKRQIASKL